MTAPAVVYGPSILNGLLNRRLNRAATLGRPLGAKFVSGLLPLGLPLTLLADSGDSDALEAVERMECIEFLAERAVDVRLDLVESMSESSLTMGVSSAEDVLLATCLSGTDHLAVKRPGRVCGCLMDPDAGW